ncbi:glypican 4 [Paragonimus westermani]|uniref:Glypican 4 n=1 Tax=Paragonimus westermani TaxID=34504 RepID=A0A5J4P2U7_9TREM|nr:glypican 4 [Paragonimus westermani]
MFIFSMPWNIFTFINATSYLLWLIHCTWSFNNCSEVVRSWEQYPNASLSALPAHHDAVMDSCSIFEDSIGTCCSSETSGILWVVGLSEFNHAWNEWLFTSFRPFWSDSLYLRRFFLTSLNSTMHTLHTSFKTTYGYNYERNQDLFFLFFDKLKKYMFGIEQNLAQIVDDFFHELLIRVVRLLLFADSDSDLQTANCVAVELEKHSPFDRIPEGVKTMTAHAFPPARIVGNALVLASETVLMLFNQTLVRSTCFQQWLKLRQCSSCYSVVDPPICLSSCRVAFSHCFASIKQLDSKWDKMLDSLLRMLTRLQGPVSFPHVNRPLQMHITDAIMSLQRVFSQMDNSIITNCTIKTEQSVIESHLARRRRSPFFADNDSRRIELDESLPTVYQVPSLTNWSREAIKKYSNFRSLFENLAIRFCTPGFLRSSRMPHQSSKTCWNGRRLVSRDEDLTASPTPPMELWSGLTDSLARMDKMILMLENITRFDADPDYLPMENPHLRDRLTYETGGPSFIQWFSGTGRGESEGRTSNRYDSPLRVPFGPGDSRYSSSLRSASRLQIQKQNPPTGFSGAGDKGFDPWSPPSSYQNRELVSKSYHTPSHAFTGDPRSSLIRPIVTSDSSQRRQYGLLAKPISRRLPPFSTSSGSSNDAGFMFSPPVRVATSFPSFYSVLNDSVYF